MSPRNQSFFRRLPLFPLFAGISLAIGFAVPVVFEWGQKPNVRGRTSAMEQGAIVTLVLAFIVCCFMVWMRRNEKDPLVSLEDSPRKFQFDLRSIFVVMTVVAISIASLVGLDAKMSNAVIVVLAMGVVVWSWFHDWTVRVRVGALLASLFLPFVWMIAYNVPFGHASGLAINIPASPAIFPTALLASLFGNAKINEMLGAAAVLVAAEMVVGAWLAWRGGKVSLIYTIVILILSSASSLAMHVLYRM